MSVFGIIILSVVLILIIISVMLYIIQDKMIFHAEKLPKKYAFSFRNKFEEINLKTHDNQILNGLLFNVNDESKGIILYFHNHSGNIMHWSSFAGYFNQLGYDVLMMDYRGYGKSTGDYNEKLMFEDSLLWYDYVLEICDENKITVYGRGLGGSFATYVASLHKPKRLILESPMYNLIFTANHLYRFIPAKSLISKYKFDTSAYIKNVKCKVFIIHGKLNTFVDFRNSVELQKLAKDNIDLLIIPDGNHYNLSNHESYLNKMDEILQ